MQDHRPSKRQEQAQESRQRLMDTALQLFAQHGYAETSVHAICAGLGVADSLLYHYFPGGKKELMQVIVDENLALVQSRLNQVKRMVGELPLEEMIEFLYQAIRKAVLNHKDIFRFLLHQQSIAERPFSQRFMGMISARQEWFQELLRSRAAAGEIDPVDCEAAADILDSMMYYYLMAELMDVHPFPEKKDAHRKKLICYQVGLWKRNK